MSSARSGDGVPPFDWLVRFVDGSIAGLEIVRAEDETVRGRFEYWLRRFTGSAPGFASSVAVPWDSSAAAVAKKSQKLQAYRRHLPQGSPMYLGVTEGVSADSPILYGEIYENVREAISAADSGFDEIYLFDGRHLAFRMEEPPTDSLYITQHVEWLTEGARGYVAREYIRRTSSGSFALNVFAPLAADVDEETVLVAVTGEGPTVRSRAERLAHALSEIRFVDLDGPLNPWEVPLLVAARRDEV